ncbi:10952_t:CDS:2, partial [Gigaspora rosea]
MTEQEVETLFKAFVNSISTDDQIIEFLAYLPQNQGGLFPIGLGLFYSLRTHKTQIETHKSTEEETRNYIQTHWVSEDFDAKDLKSSNISQPFTIVSLDKQLPIDNDISSKPAQYLMLLKSEIFHATNTSDSTSSELWNEFGRWAGFYKAQKNPLELHGIPEVLQKHPNDKLIIVMKQPRKLQDLIEHFGCFTDSNNEPNVTANTASTHCEEHRKCVRGLIQELQPISDTVNNYFGITYPTLYTKMKFSILVLMFPNLLGISLR